jgi:diketogulonate reductase-like aldo/keto reductase
LQAASPTPTIHPNHPTNIAQIQTKFSVGDPSVAHHPDIPSQIIASVASSITNLTTPDSPSPYIDCLVMHSPYPNPYDTLTAWATLSSLVPAQIRTLGISNIATDEFAHLLSVCSSSSPDMVKPSVVQNRFRRAEHAWDHATRAFCRREGIAYQGFWTLTGNRTEWPVLPFVGAVADGAGVGKATAWYSLLLADGITVLNGTTDEAHMREDLEGLDKIKVWRETDAGKEVWEKCLREFKTMVGSE